MIYVRWKFEGFRALEINLIFCGMFEMCRIVLKFLNFQAFEFCSSRMWRSLNFGPFEFSSFETFETFEPLKHWIFPLWNVQSFRFLDLTNLFNFGVFKLGHYQAFKFFNLRNIQISKLSNFQTLWDIWIFQFLSFRISKFSSFRIFKLWNFTFESFNFQAFESKLWNV